MTELEYLESVFFRVIADLKDYLTDLTLVGGWLPYVYSRFMWNNLMVKPITTTDIDFGLGTDTTKVYQRTIFDLLSSLDYKERHPQMDRMFPVVMYKEGKIRLDFIAPPKIKDAIIEKVVGKQIDINKIEKFDFLLKHRTLIEIGIRKWFTISIAQNHRRSFITKAPPSLKEKMSKNRQKISTICISSYAMIRI